MLPHRRFFIHGDMDDKTGLYFCRRCDKFSEAAHFRDAVHLGENERRVLDGLLTLRRRAANQPESAERGAETSNLFVAELNEEVQRRFRLSESFLPWVMDTTENDAIRQAIQDAFAALSRTPRYDDILDALEAVDQKAFEELYQQYLRH